MDREEVFIKICEPSGLHLGVTVNETWVLLMQPKAVEEQIWVMQRVNYTSEFMIMNKATGKYMDIQSGGKLQYLHQHRKNTNKLSQRWFVSSDGRVSNADLKLFITVLTCASVQRCKLNQLLALKDYAPFDTRQTFSFVPVAIAQSTFNCSNLLAVSQ